MTVKEEAKSILCFDQKRHIKGEKHITPMDFAEYLRKSDVSGNSKVYNILKSASHCLLVKR